MSKLSLMGCLACEAVHTTSDLRVALATQQLLHYLDRLVRR